jgi:phage terminase large subunit-like protein
MSDHQRTIRSDFSAFALRTFAEFNSGKLPERDHYLDLLYEVVEQVAIGKVKRVIVNLPPRHCKTTICTVANACWLLGHDPTLRILIVSYGDDPAADIGYDIRKVLTSPWYKKAFGTRLAGDRAGATNFGTVQGGRVIATSFGGAVTGRGADVIIVDDPTKIGDAQNLAAHDRVSRLFETEIVSRLNSRKSGRILVVAHRLHAHDLSGRLMREGGWERLVLPFKATRKERITFGRRSWMRQRGELLRPSDYDETEVAKVKGKSNFEALYQQSPPGGLDVEISADMIPEYTGPISSQCPLVVSIDPAEKAGGDRSFWVLQAWAIVGDICVLIDQQREQSGYDALRRQAMFFTRRHWPSVVLIEDIGVGASLVSHFKNNTPLNIVGIPISTRSKAKRLEECVDKIVSKKVQTQQRLVMRSEFVEELTTFPLSAYSDQVDAMTQLLIWLPTAISGLCAPPRRPVVARGVLGLPATSTRHSAYVSLGRPLLRSGNR